MFSIIFLIFVVIYKSNQQDPSLYTNDWLEKYDNYRKIILENTEISNEDNLTPEIRLHLITPKSKLWNAKSKDSPFKDNPFFAFYWAGGQGLTRYILDHPEIVKGKRVLDLGSGCGATAIAAAKCGAKSVTANDIDPRTTMSKPIKKPWRKILYGNEGYPDNYTDKSFLDEMKKNINMHQVTLREAILGAGLVTQEFCLVVIFVIVFMYLHNGWLPLEFILAQTGVVSLFCYAVCIYNQSGRLRHVRTVLVFFIFGYILSPVLKTLTESISTDTIYATTVFMMSVHLIFFDYGVKALIVSSSLSLNSAIFGAICLASRLPTSFHVFILLCLTVECFVMLPLVLAKVEGSFGTLFSLTCLTVYSLWMVSFTMTILFVVVVLFINVLCPVWFLKWYRYKENIYGPWDEAVVSLPSSNS